MNISKSINFVNDPRDQKNGGEAGMKLGETELEMVRRHVTEGETVVARQRALIAALENAGQVSETARALLVNFKRSQALHRQHLDRLLHEPRDGRVAPNYLAAPLN